MGNHQATPGVIQNVMNSSVASSVLEIENDCISSDVNDQAIIFNCNSQLDGTFYEENAACTACYKNITDTWNTQLSEEKNLWSSHGVRMRTPFDTEFREIMNAQSRCQLLCKACMFSNNSQQSTIQVKATCTFGTDQEQQIQTQISSSFMNQLYQNEDILNTFAKVMGARSDEETRTNISNLVKNTFNGDVLSQMISSVSVNQTMSFSVSGGASASINGNSQESAANLMISYLATNGISNNFLSSDQWKNFSAIYKQNTTIDELGNAVFGSVTTIAGTLDSTLGKILVAIVVILLVIVVAVVTLIIIKNVKK